MGLLKISLSALLMCTGVLTIAQDLSWSYSVGGAGEDSIKRTRIDNADNLIVAGTYDDAVYWSWRLEYRFNLCRK